MEQMNLKAAIEAILFASGASVELSRIAQTLEITESQAQNEIDALISDYNEAQRGIMIIKLHNT